MPPEASSSRTFSMPPVASTISASARGVAAAVEARDVERCTRRPRRRRDIGDVGVEIDVDVRRFDEVVAEARRTWRDLATGDRREAARRGKEVARVVDGQRRASGIRARDPSRD